ncbi:MAG TPA: response regulator [Candidatus Polarisedimenticolia bacterium]|nr:response regulator [Candidatus Polarisedimenticolia bacterium]
MTHRVVIVDDEKPARDRLRRLLADHADFVVAGEADDLPSAVALIDRERPDLCFLDVRMPEGDGFEVLRRLRHVPRVIFTTAYDEYAVKAFEVSSLDYLLKPFDRRRFAAALDRAREVIGREGPPATEILRLLQEIRAGLPKAPGDARHSSGAAVLAGAVPAGAAVPARGAAETGAPLRIPARHKSGVVLLDPADILWFEAEDTVVFARTGDARCLVDRTLSDLEAQLAPGFFRTHRCYLVNLSRIAEVRPGHEGSYGIVMRDEGRTVVPLSRRQSRRLRDLIGF